MIQVTLDGDVRIPSRTSPVRVNERSTSGSFYANDFVASEVFDRKRGSQFLSAIVGVDDVGKRASKAKWTCELLAELSGLLSTHGPRTSHAALRPKHDGCQSEVSERVKLVQPDAP